MMLIWTTQAPQASLAARETLDVALAYATYDQPVALLFSGAGVLQLVDTPLATQSGAKNIFSLIKALPVYDLEEVFVSEQDLNHFGLILPENCPAQLASDEDVEKLIAGAEHVIRI